MILENFILSATLSASFDAFNSEKYPFQKKIARSKAGLTSRQGNNSYAKLTKVF